VRRRSITPAISCRLALCRLYSRQIETHLSNDYVVREVETPSRRTVPLQNRVNPFGELCAFCARGLFMGNRGGRFHTDAKTLTRRRWASRQWICCVLEFKGRRRDVLSSSYTELFFLDEPTAFAGGHRPLRVPPQRRGRLCRKMARGAPASQAPLRGGDGRRATRRTFARTYQTPAPARHRRAARRGNCRIRWSGISHSWRHTPALDARRLPCS
jgi:hypothetical protein